MTSVRSAPVPVPRIGARAGLIAVWLVVYSNGLLFFIARQGLDRPGTWEGPVLRPAIVLSTLVGVGLVVLDGQRMTGARLRSVSRVAFGAATGFGVWAAVSAVWSLDPDISRWWGIVYIGLPCVAWVIADSSAAQIRSGVALGSGVLVVLSLVVVVIDPAVGTDINDDWRGVMTNRNGLAPICGVALFAGLALAASRRWVVGVGLSTVALIGLLGSGSRTAWLALAFGCGVATIIVGARRAFLREPRPWIPRLMFGVAAGGLFGLAAGVARLWDDPTFGQRRAIWRLVGDHIADAPVVGNGFAAFWQVPELHTDPLLQRGSAHGSVPEVLLGTGVVGLLLWATVVVLAVVGVGRAVWREPGVESWFWVALVAFLVVENLTESFILWFSYNWILLIAAALRFGVVAGSRPVRTPERVPALAD